MENFLKKIKRYYNWGGRFLNDPYHLRTLELNKKEGLKTPSRTEIINYLLGSFGNKPTTYLEIGVRNPDHNFNHIKSTKKYSVDPGIEFSSNPVDFKVTSDVFFKSLSEGKLLSKETVFDVIFIDGLHLAEQVERDIENALQFLSDEGFIVMHDCNPPSEWHAREEYGYQISPAMNNWNGTTWKAFFKARKKSGLYSCCIDTDWGVGIISKKINLGMPSSVSNPFFEFKTFENNRKESLNLITFDEFKNLL